jgi:hypothetical protein
MERNIEIQNASTIMFDGEEAIQGAESKVRNREGVECGNRFAVVVQKSAPVTGPAFARNALELLQILRHGGSEMSKPSRTSSLWMCGAPTWDSLA